MMVSTILTWEWKSEPVSPPTLYEDTVLFDDSTTTSSDQTAFDLESSIVKNEDELSIGSPENNKAEVFSKLLEDIENFDQFEDIIKEESFSWFEGKSDLPIFEDLPIETARTYPVQRYKTEELKPIQYVVPIPQPVEDTNVLIQEFETVFDAVEMTHNTLTPPQSPPSVENNKPFITTLQSLNFQQIPTVYYPPIDRELQPGTPQPDVAHELAVVEELVRTRAEKLVDYFEEPTRSESITSPSSPSSSSSNSEYSSDPEWIPEPVQSSEYVVKSSKGRKRSTKPYSRTGPEDKKSRKKEQNKNAATRYRQKKKAEIEEILSEEKGLMDQHDKLEADVTDLQREIKYLKGLMRDLFKAKGLLK